MVYKTAYVNGPEALLEVVRSEQVSRTGKFVKKSILESEHGGGPDKSCLWVDRACYFLTPSL